MTRPFLRVLPLLALLLLGFPASLRAQGFSGGTPLPPAELQLLDSAGAAHLENARQLLAQQKWDEAVEAIRRVLENDSGRLIHIDTRTDTAAGKDSSFRWHIPVREYCHWRLAALAWEAPPALVAYRQLVDPLAERWYRDALAKHQVALLRRVVDEAWASRWGDDAALALGDDALSRGDLVRARHWWERTGLGFVTREGQPLWLIVPLPTAPQVRERLDSPKRELGPYYPDSDLPPADVRARSILGAILSGHTERAQIELAWFRTLHAKDEGQIAGRRGNYVELLTQLQEQAKTWPPVAKPEHTRTYAATVERNGSFVSPPDPAGQPLWTTPLPRLPGDRDLIGAGRLRVADDGKSLASYFPVTWNNDVLVRADARGESYLAAFDLESGSQRWRLNYPRQASRDQEPPADDGTLGEINDVHADLARHVGVARYSLTVHGDKAFARLGSPVTVPRSRRLERLLAKDQGWLIGVDLAADGKMLSGFPLRPESPEWSFEGAPIVHEGALYVAMRHVEGSRSQLHIACFELPTTSLVVNDEDDNARPTGRLRFRTRIASAATLGGGNLDELSHVLLTAAHGQISCNTNGGAVGAVDAATGQLCWVVTYPRSAWGDDSISGSPFFRDLNPCLASGSSLIVAPQDCEQLFALDLLSGRPRWQTPAGLASDATYLAGVRNGTLIAAGDRVYWFDAYRGHLLAQYPAGRNDSVTSAAASPRGLGQGVIAGDQFWWPTRESILVLAAEPPRLASGYAPALLRDIPLVPRGVTGGNLLIEGDRLLITGGTQLSIFGPQPPAKPSRLPEVR
jgi:hypothetical protein